VSRAPVRERDEAPPESDVFEGAPHPRHAAKLFGHAAAEAEMLNAYRSGRLAHAWLIGGREGIGKATLAWRFARFVLAFPDPGASAVASARDLSVPASHPAARQLEALAHPDFALLRRTLKEKSTAADPFYTEIRVDDVRAEMRILQLSAAFGGWRVAIVDSADDLNRNSANALLKIIEEPPPKSLILMLAHRMGAVMPTIRSRCRRLLLDPLTPDEIAAAISGLGPPWADAGADRIAAAAFAAGGSMREALKRLDPENHTIGAMIESAVSRLPRGDLALNLRLCDAVNARGADDHFQRLMLALLDWLAEQGRKPSSPGRLEAIADLWQTLRGYAREADALNLDKRATALAAFEEIISRAGALG
jgi:DNA polymerase-3 subunit delta'